MSRGEFFNALPTADFARLFPVCSRPLASVRQAITSKIMQKPNSMLAEQGEVRSDSVRSNIPQLVCQRRTDVS